MTSKHVKSSNEMVVPRNKNKVLCSTPEHRNHSPSRDSDSLYDSDCASPVPFLCTQDGTEGETDVIWNHYTPKSGNKALKNTTPLSRRRSKKSLRPKVLEKPIIKKKVRPSEKKIAFLQDLLEFNQNLLEIINNKSEKNSNPVSDDSEEDIFGDAQDFSPKSHLRTNTCLRKNLLSSKFSKPEPEIGLDSDDSLNECLIKASQMVEENILKEDIKSRSDVPSNKTKCTNSSFVLNQDSMDAILISKKMDSPCAKQMKNFKSPQLVNDSFDSFMENLNDTALEKLTQMPTKIRTPGPESKSDNSNELHLDFNGSFSKSFSRHSSMPESPSVGHLNKPSTSGMAFGRHSSMPMDRNQMDLIDSPIRCTPDEIKKKHQIAREKLLAKRQFTPLPSLNALPSIPGQINASNNYKFQPKFPSNRAFIHKNNVMKPNSGHPSVSNRRNNTETDMKSIIEGKRQEALKLRLRKQTLGKI